MIWFKLKKLEKKLAAGEVSEKTGVMYLLTWILFFAVLFYLPKSSGPFSNEWWELGSFILNLGILIWAIGSLFRINHKNGNGDFLKKFLSLAFVTGLRLLLTYSFLWLTYKIFMYNIPDDLFLFISSLWLEDVADLIHSLTLTMIFSIMLIRSFKRANNENLTEVRTV